MPTFSIYSPTIDPAEAALAGLPASPVPAIGKPSIQPSIQPAIQPAIVQPAVASGGARGGALSTAAATALRPAMHVVLRVPDLAAAPEVGRGKRSTVADAMYWAIIVAGTAIAMWLIWQGEAVPNGAPDDIIPSSSQQAPAEAFQSATNTAGNETAPAQPPVVYYTARLIDERRPEPMEAYPAAITTQFDATSTATDAQPRPDAQPRTTLPAYNPAAARPGEAAPLGTIINTQVNP